MLNAQTQLIVYYINAIAYYINVDKVTSRN